MNPWTTGQEDQGCYLPTKAEIEDHKTAIRIANTIKFLMATISTFFAINSFFRILQTGYCPAF